MSKQNEGSLLGKVARYTETLAADPKSTDFVHLAEAYLQLGLPGDALEVAMRGVAELPRFAPGHVALGRILLETGELQKSAAAFQAACELDPRSLPALKGLAGVTCRLGDRKKAADLLRQAVADHPDDPALSRLVATLERRQEDAPSPQPAPPRSHPSRARETEEPIATPTIAEIYLRQGLPRRALKVYGDLLKAHPDNGDLKIKYRALEERIRAEEAQLEEAAPPTPPPAAPREAPQERSAAATSRGSARPEDSVVGLLNRWLESIRRRKAHVQ